MDWLKSLLGKFNSKDFRIQFSSIIIKALTMFVSGVSKEAFNIAMKHVVLAEGKAKSGDEKFYLALGGLKQELKDHGKEYSDRVLEFLIQSAVVAYKETPSRF